MINSSISFCIATAKNEKEYVLLLLRSLRDNTDITKHEIVIFIDSDNQNTYEALLQEQQNMPNIKICKNPYDHPIGSQRNVSVLFNAAKNDIVCYLQSDMVVGKDIDKYISENMISEDIVLTCARIEPPLHPPGSEKMIIDLGVTPEKLFDHIILALSWSPPHFVEDISSSVLIASNAILGSDVKDINVLNLSR